MYERRIDAKDDLGEILHSWKSIANFLSRSVRTARRWEENEDLPVRRHMHLKNNTVYAYTGELELWLRLREHPNPKLIANNNHSYVKKEPNFWKGVTRWFQ